MKEKNLRSILIINGKTVLGFLILIALYLIGEVLSDYIPFPVPGPVVGLLLIFVLLLTGTIRLDWVEEASRILLVFLGMFYVPFGVGIMGVDQSVKDKALLIVLTAVVVTIVVMWSSGRLFTALAEKNQAENG